MLKYPIIIMEFEWKVHPLIDRPLKSVMLMAVLIIIGYFIYHIFAPFFLLLYIVFFLFSFSSYWFPTLYRLSEESVLIKRLLFKFRKNLDYYRRIYTDKGGIFLSPYREHHFLERTRGLYLLCPKEKREEVENFLKKVVEE